MAFLQKLYKFPHMCTIFINVHSTTTWPHSLWSMSSIKVDFLPWIQLGVAVSTSGSRGPSSTEVLPVAVYIVRRPEAGQYRSGRVKALNTQMFKLFKMYSHLLSSELLPSLGEYGRSQAWAQNRAGCSQQCGAIKSHCNPGQSNAANYIPMRHANKNATNSAFYLSKVKSYKIQFVLVLIMLEYFFVPSVSLKYFCLT